MENSKIKCEVDSSGFSKELHDFPIPLSGEVPRFKCETGIRDISLELHDIPIHLSGEVPRFNTHVLVAFPWNFMTFPSTWVGKFLDLISGISLELATFPSIWVWGSPRWNRTLVALALSRWPGKSLFCVEQRLCGHLIWCWNKQVELCCYMLVVILSLFGKVWVGRGVWKEEGGCYGQKTARWIWLCMQSAYRKPSNCS